MIDSKVVRQIKHLKVCETDGKTGNDGIKAQSEAASEAGGDGERFSFCCLLGLGLCRLSPGNRRV